MFLNDYNKLKDHTNTLPMRIISYLLLILSVLINYTSGKIYDRCELAEKLRYKHNLSLEQVGVWICIAKYQSNFNSELMNIDSDGVGYHGLYQISDQYWCSSKGSNVCQLECWQLKDDDLYDDFGCIAQIFEEHERISGSGYNAWPVFQKYCTYTGTSLIDDCFTKKPTTAKTTISTTKKQHDKKISIQPINIRNKIYHRCELARELNYIHKIPMNEISTWVCIAKYESNYNTSAVGHLNVDGSGDHGLFQISDIYWCSPPGQGWVCKLSCAKLEDSDISDDVKCMRQIFDEHQRLSGNGFNAWTVYKPYCQYNSDKFIDGCFSKYELSDFDDHSIVVTTPAEKKISKLKQSVRGKIFTRCELARELFFTHKISMNHLSTWVCIAQHESNYNTSAVGHLNTDGSGDHGLFQISDIYWCSPPGKGWACGLSCDQLEDSDITDDVNCMKTIYEEHQRISGDGFTAWAVYNPYCRGRHQNSYITGCFDDNDDNNDESNSVFKKRPAITAPTPTRSPLVKQISPSIDKGKIYDRCELATELHYQHDIPMEHISTWVCIAMHESRFNTSAVGHLNADGSGDHGLFQISDIYWCSPPGKGKGCDLTCAELEDSDITNDVKCMKIIYEEHQRISGNGYTAWAVYNPYCRGISEHHYINGCFNEDNSVLPHRPAITAPPPTRSTTIKHQLTTKNKIFNKSSQRYGKGKVYERCELAKELRFVHKLPKNQISTWVCIANFESHFNTSIVGRRNADGSGDHGIFQISDLFWCSLSPETTWMAACGLTCNKLIDSDITDDVLCVKQIYEEHQRLSGDGFTAWVVYNQHCRDGDEKLKQYVAGCFDSDNDDDDDDSNSIYFSEYQPSFTPTDSTQTTNGIVNVGKVYSRCELALELHNIHNIPKDQVGTWVCIAKYESQYNTSAIGYGDHGLFQISDIYWCSPPGKGWVCGLSCAKLEDNDITDDVECMKTIFNEHQRLSGDGFTAWTVYPRYCKGRGLEFTADCFDDTSTTTLKPTTTITSTQLLSGSRVSSSTIKYNSLQNQLAISTKKPYIELQNRKTPTTRKQIIQTTSKKKLITSTKTTTKKVTINTTKPSISTKRTTTPRSVKNSTTAKSKIVAKTITPIKKTITSTYPTVSTRTTTRTITKPTTSVQKKQSTPSIGTKTTTPIPIKTTTESPFAIYFNGYQTKMPTTFYKFSTWPIRTVTKQMLATTTPRIVTTPSTSMINPFSEILLKNKLYSEIQSKYNTPKQSAVSKRPVLYNNSIKATPSPTKKSQFTLPVNHHHEYNLSAAATSIVNLQVSPPPASSSSLSSKNLDFDIKNEKITNQRSSLLSVTLPITNNTTDHYLSRLSSSSTAAAAAAAESSMSHKYNLLQQPTIISSQSVAFNNHDQSPPPESPPTTSTIVYRLPFKLEQNTTMTTLSSYYTSSSTSPFMASSSSSSSPLLSSSSSSPSPTSSRFIKTSQSNKELKKQTTSTTTIIERS